MKDILAKWHWLLADPLCLERDEFGSRQPRWSMSTEKSALAIVDGIFHDPLYKHTHTHTRAHTHMP